MFTKIRFKLEIIYLYLKRHKLILTFLTLILAILFLFRKNLVVKYNQYFPKIEKIGIEGQYKYYNLPKNISQKISYGITTGNHTGHFDISPLIEKIDINEEKHEYNFTLKDNQYWHSGKELVAKDFNYQIPGLSFTYPSSKQVIITSETAFSPILSTLSQPLIKKNLDGLGPFTVKKNLMADGYLKRLDLRSADKFYSYRFYQSENDLINAFKIGEVDTIEITSLPGELEKWPDLSINKKIQTDEKYIAVFINTSKFPEKQFRQALSYATPKTTDLNDRALSPISPDSWAYNPSVKNYNYDQQRAVDFFSKNKIDSINLVYNDQRLVSLADNIKKSWEDTLGLKVNAQLTTQIDIQNYDTLLAYGSITSDPDQYLFWHSTQSKTNLTKINHPPIDKLLEEGRQIFDLQERKKIYQEFQKILLEECPAIFLKFPTVYTVSRK